MEKEADQLVERFVLRQFKSGNSRGVYNEAWNHLQACESAHVVGYEATDGTYGCDTGCEYARLEATIGCEHGQRTRSEYGTFGELSDLLEEVHASR